MRPHHQPGASRQAQRGCTARERRTPSLAVASCWAVPVSVRVLAFGRTFFLCGVGLQLRCFVVIPLSPSCWEATLLRYGTRVPRPPAALLEDELHGQLLQARGG